MNTHRRPWVFNVGKTRVSKTLYTRPRWGLMFQNIPGYVEEAGIVTPWFTIQRSVPALTCYHLVFTVGTYKEEMVSL